MKRINLFCALLLIAGAFGQVQAFEPIVKENKQWVYYENSRTKENGKVKITYFPIVYEFKGDTLINGEVYKRLWEDRYKGAEGHRPLDEVIHTNKVVAYVREYNPYMLGPCVFAVRADSYEPLVGIYRGHTDDGRGIYLIYNETGHMGHALDESPMSAYDREHLFDFKGREYTYETVEGGNGELICFPTTNPYARIVEGVGFFICGYPYLTRTNANFIDLRGHYTDEFENYIDRVLSHVLLDGEIYYKTEMYDFIQEYGTVYDPNTPKGGDEPSGVGEVPVDGGASVDGRTYDMQGRVVSDPSVPGIYVRDGQKILVK